MASAAADNDTTSVCGAESLEKYAVRLLCG